MDDSAVPQAQVSGCPSEFGESAVLLDVREDDEWQRGHAPDAQHIPMGDVPARIDEIDPDKDLFVICHCRWAVAAGGAVPAAQRLRAGQRRRRHAGLGPGGSAGGHRRRRTG